LGHVAPLAETLQSVTAQRLCETVQPAQSIPACLRDGASGAPALSQRKPRMSRMDADVSFAYSRRPRNLRLAKLATDNRFAFDASTLCQQTSRATKSL